MATNQEMKNRILLGVQEKFGIYNFPPYICLMKNKTIRSFKGVLITAKNYREIIENEGRQAINFHTKHLKCYLRGDRSFTFGKDPVGNPIIHKV